jgi:hypothetical protein
MTLLSRAHPVVRNELSVCHVCRPVTRRRTFTCDTLG